MPLVSVIMPAYNAERYIGEAIQSVLAQTLADWELIIVDDGSTDHTAEIVRRFEDPRIRYVYQENSGPYLSRNRGIELAGSPHIAFLDADDLFLPRKLAWQVEVLEKEPEAGLVAGGHHVIDSEGRLLATFRPWTTFPSLDVTTWLFACPVWLQHILIRRDWLERVGGFDSRDSTGDYDLLLRLAHAGCKMVWLREIVFCYRLHEANSIRQVSKVIEGHRQVIEKFYNRPDLGDGSVIG